MYAAAGRDLFTMSDPQQRAAHLRGFGTKLRDRTPDQATFTAQFLELRFTSSDTKQKPLVRYVLERLDEFHRQDKNVDYDKMTVEHISPERPAHDTKVTNVGAIGNLIFVSEDTNLKLKNKDFSEKKVILEEEHVPLDPILQAATAWTDKEIQKRSEYLATIALEKIWKL
jgi:hypothetical protein